jgi:perosamine synthetase
VIKIIKKQFKINWSPPAIEKEEKQAAIKVINSGWMTQGEITEKLEKKICQYTGAKYAVVTNNGTSALICSLLAHGIGPGDEVIIPSFTFVATVNSVLAVGAQPVLVDCDLRTFNTTIDLMKQKLSKKTRCIIPVDVAGMPVDIDKFRKFAKENNLILIEDAAEAIGASYKNKILGSFGHTTIFSFHMAKVVAGIEGGCIVTNDKKIVQLAKLIRSHGDANQYDSRVFGLNFRISDVHSAIILEQLKKINRFLNHRKKIASIYKDELKNCTFQETPEYVTRHPYMLFYALFPAKTRKKINDYLNKNGIETRICWPPVHLQKYHSILFKNSIFPNSEKIHAIGINLPMGNSLSEENTLTITNLIKNVINNNN